MGGQIAAERSLHLDMRQFNQVVHFSPAESIVRVQSGMRWRELQDLIDPHDLSVKIMQSFSNFTIGGSVSVNAHGRYVGAGPLVLSVRAIELVLPDGQVVEATPTKDAELFFGVVGGYGGLGIITEVELELAPNVRMERRAHRTPVTHYREFFIRQVYRNADAILHNADLMPPDFSEASSVTWFRTAKPLTVQERLVAQGQDYKLESSLIWAVSELPGGQRARSDLLESLHYLKPAVVWRNYEASLDVASLGAISNGTSTYALQEYFIPITRFDAFVPRMAAILRRNRANVLNISVRYAHSDPGSLLAWARNEVFSFVLYYKQSTSQTARAQVGNWTRELVEAALSQGGTYYLPYQLHATRQQFVRAYPDSPRFFALKRKVDPKTKLRNKLWDKYSP